MVNLSRYFCVNCGHSSALKSNFKLTNDGKAYCIKKCVELYETSNWNDGARQKGGKVE